MTDWPKIPRISYEVTDLGGGRREIVVQKLSLGALGEWSVPNAVLEADTTERELNEVIEEYQDALDRIFLKIAAAIVTENRNPFDALQTLLVWCEAAWTDKPANSMRGA